MKYLLLRNGGQTIVDDDMYDYLSQWSWGRVAGRYAGRSITKNGASRILYLHRYINDTPDGQDTDHINQDKLDNRRCNLRTLARSQNMRNCMQRNNTSGYRGVSWHTQRNKWTARAKIGGIYKSLGLYDTPEEASKAYQDTIAKVMPS